MTRWLFLFVCGGLCACTADLEEPPAAQVDESQHPLEGRWHLEAVQSDTTCPDFDIFGTVDVREVVIQRVDAGWELAGAGSTLRLDEVSDHEWIGHTSMPYEGCTLDAETRYEIVGVGPTSLAAWRTTSYRVSGSDCGYAANACVVTHAVRGVR